MFLILNEREMLENEKPQFCPIMTQDQINKTRKIVGSYFRKTRPTNDIFVYDGDSVSLFDTICDADAKLHIRELALYARIFFPEILLSHLKIHIFQEYIVKYI